MRDTFSFTEENTRFVFFFPVQDTLCASFTKLVPSRCPEPFFEGCRKPREARGTGLTPHGSAWFV